MPLPKPTCVEGTWQRVKQIFLILKLLVHLFEWQFLPCPTIASWYQGGIVLLRPWSQMHKVPLPWSNSGHWTPSHHRLSLQWVLHNLYWHQSVKKSCDIKHCSYWEYPTFVVVAFALNKLHEIDLGQFISGIWIMNPKVISFMKKTCFIANVGFKLNLAFDSNGNTLLITYSIFVSLKPLTT